LITHLVEEDHFEDEGDLHIFLRKHHAHELTPKGRLWEFAEGTLNLRFPEPAMEKFECQDGGFVLDWVVNENEFAIALMDDGREERGSVLGASKKMFYAITEIEGEGPGNSHQKPLYDQHNTQQYPNILKSN
jgi:hypothetical protein